MARRIKKDFWNDRKSNSAKKTAKAIKWLKRSEDRNIKKCPNYNAMF